MRCSPANSAPTERTNDAIVYSAQSVNARRSYKTATSKEKAENVVNAPRMPVVRNRRISVRGGPGQGHRLDQHPHGETADDIDDQCGVGRKAYTEQVPDRDVDQVVGDRANHSARRHREQFGNRHMVASSGRASAQS
jgi:hypothetical protein